MSPEAPSSPYRAIRRLSAARDSPYAGDLVHSAAGERLVAVDAAAFGGDWPGWRADAGGHILRAVDVVRRADGHDVLLPLCLEPATAFVARRARAGRPLGPGELVTLGVSLLRAVAELDPAARTSFGHWWLDVRGRPVIAMGAGDRPAVEATLALVRAVDPGGLATEWEGLSVALSGRIVGRDLDDAENALFRAAAPAPLQVDDPAGGTALRGLGGDSIDARPADGAATIAAAAEDGWMMRAARAVDADTADIVGRIGTSLWRRARRPASRRRVWAVAAGAAAVTVAGGLLWPAAAGGDADPSPPALSAPSASSAPPAPPAADDEPDAAADRLLTARAACAGAGECLAAVQEDAGRDLPRGAVDLPSADRDVVLLEDLGDVAVVRVSARAGATAAQIVIIARTDATWLLRDVYDVAQQP